MTQSATAATAADLRRCVVELVHAEAHRNERRINTVKMGLVAIGILITLTFWMKDGDVVKPVVMAQVAVMCGWLAVMLAVAGLLRQDHMHRGVPYLVISTDVTMIGALVAVRMSMMPEAYQVKDGVLSDWVFLMLFPILASAGPRFDRDVARFAELAVTICTLGLLVFDILVLGTPLRPFFPLIALVALLGTGRFAVMVSDRGRALIEGAARWGARHALARKDTRSG